MKVSHSELGLLGKFVGGDILSIQSVTSSTSLSPQTLKRRAEPADSVQPTCRKVILKSRKIWGQKFRDRLSGGLIFLYINFVISSRSLYLSDCLWKGLVYMIPHLKFRVHVCIIEYIIAP